MSIVPTIPQGDKVEFYISATDLPKADLLSQSDGFAAVYLRSERDAEPALLGITEVHKDTPNPKWTQQFQTTYLFHTLQTIVIRIYDYDGGPTTEFHRHDFLGEVSFVLGSVLAQPGGSLVAPLGSTSCKVTMHAETISSDTQDVVLNITGKKLANKDGFFGTSDPFLVISRLNEDGSYLRVYQNEPIMNNLNPVFPSIVTTSQVLCNNDLYRPLRIEVFDWDSNGKSDFMGMVDTSLHQLTTTSTFDVIEPKKQEKSKKYINSGTLTIQMSMKPRASLVQYIEGGLEVSLMVAIDYTLSNGPPHDRNSLHYLSEGYNSYQTVICAVGSIVEAYDSDRMFPVFGFGAKLNTPSGLSGVEHCFAVSPGGYEVHGIAGVLQAYTSSLQCVQLSGPTLFSPIISEAHRRAIAQPCTQQNQKYHILLIITDGVINDMHETIEVIVRASDSPLSIIIVGVGNADFSGMNHLDADGGPLTSRSGVKAVRDIVQFVPFSQFVGKPMDALAKAVLAEIPEQIVGYFQSHNITPNPKRAAPSAPPMGADAPPPPPPSYETAVGGFSDAPPSYAP